MGEWVERLSRVERLPQGTGVIGFVTPILTLTLRGKRVGRHKLDIIKEARVM